MNSELEVDIYSRISEKVKAIPSTITQEELDKLRKARVIFNSDISNLYGFLVPKSGDRLCHIKEHAGTAPD
ncbi:hypothetical protein AHAS_Ahas12G0119600 [Arachis hypogaea]